IELAEEAAQQEPFRPAIVRLAPWLELYERGAIARALPYFVADKKPLSAFIPRENRDIGQTQGQLNPTKNLIITEVRHFQQRVFLPTPHREDFCTFEVHGVFSDQDIPQLILRCRGIPVDTA